jgi:hypothetical protein
MADHEWGVSDVGLNMSLLTIKELKAVRKDTRTASIPAGINSERVWDVPIAAAANEPVQGPKQKVLAELGYGWEPSPKYLR